MSLAVAFVHAKTDAEFKRVRPMLTCRAVGCSACCNCDTPAHPEEIRALVPHVSPEAWRRVAEVAALPLMEMLTRRCPLLDPGTRACTVYAHRPGVCRAYNSTENPKHCDTAFGLQTVASMAEPGIAMQQAVDNVLPGGMARFELMIPALARLAP